MGTEIWDVLLNRIESSKDLELKKDAELLKKFFTTDEWKKFLQELNKTSVFETLLIFRKLPQVIENKLKELKARISWAKSKKIHWK